MNLLDTITRHATENAMPLSGLVAKIVSLMRCNTCRHLRVYTTDEGVCTGALKNQPVHGITKWGCCEWEGKDE